MFSKRLGFHQRLLLVLFVTFPSASSTTFYIVTSLTSGSPCPGEFTGEPCLTLQQYVTNPSQSRENITFQFEPGTHYLHDVLSVSNGYNLTMSSTNATVICTAVAGRIAISSVENVHISGMTFRWCNDTVITMSSVTRASIVGNTFSTNRKWYGFGGCLSLTSTSVTITDCVFDNNYGYFGGGGILATLSNITVSRSVFTYTGSGVIEASASNITIDSCTCINSSASRNKGIVYVTSSSSITIDRSTFSKTNNNRAISSVNSNVMINRSSFSHNSYGGAIVWFTDYLRTLEINNTVFHANSAYDRRYGAKGGALYIHAYLGYRLIHNCTFTSNVAIGNSLGGAIYNYQPTRGINQEGALIVSQCTFINNTAGSGGAVYSTGSNNEFITVQSYYENNTASSYGGAVYVDGTNSSVSVTGSYFINNTALTQGGGAIYSNGRYVNITLASSTFNYNSASYCGVLDLDDYYHFSVDFTDSVFMYNTASGQSTGGGVACIRNASININRSTFKHNFANFHGGVLYIDESNTTVNGSLFVNNSAALDGGVFFTYVHTSNYSIRRSQFTQNSAGDDGGVIFIGRELSRINIEETIFSFNGATDRGGVVAIVNCSMYMEINRTNIFNNTALFGGVISACNSDVTLSANELLERTDPVYVFCSLYEGDINHFDISIPPPTTTHIALPTPPTTMETTGTINVSPTTEEGTGTVPPTGIENVETAQPTTMEDMSTLSQDRESTSKTPVHFTSIASRTTDTSHDPRSPAHVTEETTTAITLELETATTKYQPTTTRMVDIDNGDKDDTGGGFMQIVIIVLAAVSLAISLAAIMVIFLLMLQFYKFKKEAKKVFNPAGETYRNPDTGSVHTYEPMDGTVV